MADMVSEAELRAESEKNMLNKYINVTFSGYFKGVLYLFVSYFYSQ